MVTEAHVCEQLPKNAPKSAAAGSRTRDLVIASPAAPCPHATESYTPKTRCIKFL